MLAVDPRVCDAARPPRLVTAVSPARVEATAAMLDRTVAEGRYEPADADKLVARTNSDPCASAIAGTIG
jgi:hypothetical protein